jgi:hypothetical protein
LVAVLASLEPNPFDYIASEIMHELAGREELQFTQLDISWSSFGSILPLGDK